MVLTLLDPQSQPSNYSSLDAHGHHFGSHAAHGPEGGFSSSDKAVNQPDKENESSSDIENGMVHKHQFTDNVLAQIVGVAILEFGIVLHRYECHTSPDIQPHA